MARSESAKRADQKYKAEKTKRVTLRFYPADEDVFSHLQRQRSMQGYIKDLIREDMGAWYGTTGEAFCRECGYTLDVRKARRLGACPNCGHGQE